MSGRDAAALMFLQHSSRIRGKDQTSRILSAVRGAFGLVSDRGGAPSPGGQLLSTAVTLIEQL